MQKSLSNVRAAMWLVSALMASMLIVAISFWIYPRAAAVASLICIAALMIEIRLSKRSFDPGRSFEAGRHHSRSADPHSSF